MMKLEEIEEAIYTNEEFLDKLEILKEEKWKKATLKERAQFFSTLHKLVCSVDDSFCEQVTLATINENIPNQTFFVVDEGLVLNREYFKKPLNPYRLISNYIFELQLDSNLLLAEQADAFDSETGRIMVINTTVSVFNNWTNYFERDSEDFYYQPVTYKSVEVASDFTYKFVKYMHKKYGMDGYIGDFIGKLMVASFDKERMKKKVEKNFISMEKRYEGYKDEIEKITKIANFLSDTEDFALLKEEDFLSLFNKNLISNYSCGFRLAIYREFGKRILKGYDEVDKVVEQIGIGVNDEDGEFLVVGDKEYILPVEREFTFVVNKYINTKIANNLLDEISDDKLREEAVRSYKYLQALKDDKILDEASYIVDASPYNEVRKYLLNRYHLLIKKAIEKSSYFNDGAPLIHKDYFSKLDTFFMFAFGKKYDDFNFLEDEYNKKKGGR